MSARDDLVAAMEALDRARNATGHYFQVEALPEVQAAALSLLRDHGKHLLALLDAEPVAAALRERDRIVCEAIMEVCGEDLKQVSALLDAINKRRKDILPTYWCDKCGYSGFTGPKHDGCDYHAAFSPGPPPAEPTLEEVLAELAGQEFFHDGLAGDLHDVPDKAHAYRLGWDECIQAARECLRRVKE